MKKLFVVAVPILAAFLLAAISGFAPQSEEIEFNAVEILKPVQKMILGEQTFSDCVTVEDTVSSTDLVNGFPIEVNAPFTTKSVTVCFDSTLK